MAVPLLSNSGVPQDAAAALAKLYTDAYEKLERIVMNPPGGTEAARAYAAARAAQQLKQVDAILAQLKGQTAQWIGDNLPKAFIDGINLGNTQAAKAGVDVPDSPTSGSFGLIDQGTMKQFANDIYSDLNGGIDSMGQTVKRALRKTAQTAISQSQIDQILAGGVISGQPYQTIKELRAALEAVTGKTLTVIDKNGDPIEFKASYYASLVVRTKTRQATVQARHERLGSLGLDLVSIIGRISDNFCTAYLGEVFSLSGSSDKYPALSSLPSGGPPFHPNCSKSTRPFVEALASQSQLDRADDAEDSMLNVDASTAQKNFKNLQLRSDTTARYGTTADKIYGS